MWAPCQIFTSPGIASSAPRAPTYWPLRDFQRPLFLPPDEARVSSGSCAWSIWAGLPAGKRLRVEDISQNVLAHPPRQLEAWALCPSQA